MTETVIEKQEFNFIVNIEEGFSIRCNACPLMRGKITSLDEAVAWADKHEQEFHTKEIPWEEENSQIKKN